MPDTIPVDPEALRADVREKYREVALHPEGEFHFHTGRRLATKLGYPDELVQRLPDSAVESFAGVGNPFAMRPLKSGERVVDFGSGGGFDCFVAADAVGASGRVLGVDMTPEMLAKSRATAHALGATNVEFREGVLEAVPVEDGWADVVISNGVINLCADKAAVFAEAYRLLRPGGSSSSPISPTANRFPTPRCARSTYGRVASPAGFRSTTGSRRSALPGSSTSALVWQSTPSVVQAARPTPARSTSPRTCSWRPGRLERRVSATKRT